jgi:hypothetical protein
VCLGDVAFADRLSAATQKVRNKYRIAPRQVFLFAVVGVITIAVRLRINTT